MAGLITEVGTPPQLWHTWPGLERLPALDLGRCDRMLVVAAHPDDETLGAAALLAAAARRAVELQVLVLTEGEASHPGSPTLRPTQLAELRRAEVRVGPRPARRSHGGRPRRAPRRWAGPERARRRRGHRARARGAAQGRRRP